MTYRILRANRARIDGPSLGTLALHGAAFVLTLVGALGRRKGSPKVRERPTASGDAKEEYRRHLYAELEKIGG